MLRGDADGPHEFVDSVAYGPTASGQSWGLVPDGNDVGFALESPSPGAANGAADLGPLVISEVHYHPADPSETALRLDGQLQRNDLEFVEIANRSSETVPLDGWRLRGDVDYDFPADQTLGPQTTLLVLSFNPAREDNAPRLAAFRAEFQVSVNTTLVGGFGGQLNNAGSRLTLQRPASVVPGQEPATSRLLADEVRFGDLPPWPSAADGGGASLQRRSVQSVGSDPSNWQAGAPTAGSYEFSATRPGDFDGNGQLDGTDIRLLCEALQRGTASARFDLSGDGQLTVADRDHLIFGELGTTYGDANLDGRFDSADLVQVFTSGEYEDGRARNSVWADGDWNCDGDFDSGDLVLAFASGGYEQPAAAPVRFSPRRPQQMAHPDPRPPVRPSTTETALHLDWPVRDAVFAEIADETIRHARMRKSAQR